MNLNKNETELLSALVYFLNMGMIDLHKIKNEYYEGEESFIDELDLSVSDELEKKLDDYIQLTK